MGGWLSEFVPILVLLGLVAVVVARLPKIELGHTPAYRRRRFFNWFPVGLTYAFLYMGRYNLQVCTNIVFDKAQFSQIYFWGMLTYGVSFLLNGPIADRIGGKKTITMAACGALVANIAMGIVIMRAMQGTEVPKEARAGLVPTLSFLYAVNMYFQSFGAVAIVKVNSAWFHIRERGTFGGIFGILISLGLYFAFDWCRLIVEASSAPYAFFVPAGILAVFAILDATVVKDTPGEAGFEDFDLGDASSGETGPRDRVIVVVKKMLAQPAILIIAAIEFFSGYLRNAILQYYKPFAEETGRAATPPTFQAAKKAGAEALAALPHDLVHDHWGMLNCMAGITGAVLAGLISDRVFGSRRGPVAAVLYGVILVGALVMFPTMQTILIGWTVVLMTLAILGVHGMLSGTASMDFGGKRNVGIVVGVIDGMVYLGTSLESQILGKVLPKGDAAKDAANWWTWPAVILPAAVLGLVLATRVWNARPVSKSAAAH